MQQLSTQTIAPLSRAVNWNEAYSGKYSLSLMMSPDHAVVTQRSSFSIAVRYA
jgi:hypothetical protein